MAQAAHSAGVPYSTPADASYRAFFGTPTSGEVVPLRPEVLRALSAAGLSDGATGTLQLLYSYALLSIWHGHVREDDGWVMVWPSRERIAQETGKKTTAVKEHLRALEEAGALYRAPERVNGRTGVLWLRPVMDLVEYLEDQESVKAELARRFPDSYDRKVTPLFSRLFASHTPLSAPTDDSEVRRLTRHARARMAAEDRTPSPALEWEDGWDDERFSHWKERRWLDTLEEEMKSPYALIARLRAEQAEAEAASAAVKEKRESKSPAQKMGGGRKRPKAAERTDSATALMHTFREAVVTNFPTAFRPPVDVKSLSQMKELVTRFGEEDTRLLINFVTVLENWQKVKARWPKIELFQPTPGWMLAWSQSLLDWIKNGAPASGASTGPKRSGGAEVYERPTTDSKGRATF